MTAQYIKDYIDEQIEELNKTLHNTDTPSGINYIGGKIQGYIECRDMLDQIDDRPKAKWTNNMNGTFTCSRCGAKRPNDNYCGNCGAKMEPYKENNKC